MTIDISKEEHRKLKAIAALAGKSMREIVLEAVKEYFDKHFNGKVPKIVANIKTKAIKETR